MMSENRKTICESAFKVYFRKIPAVAEYARVVVPILPNSPEAKTIFVDSMIVLTMAWLEDFLKSILSCGVRHAQTEARLYFATNGTDDERSHASICDLPTLIRMAWRRVSWKKEGRRIDQLVSHLFGFSVWPNPEVKASALDLNVLRQLIVHHGGASLGEEYWSQLSDRTLVRRTAYGPPLPAIHRLDYERCYLFTLTALQALVKQAQYIQEEMLKQERWTERSV